MTPKPGWCMWRVANRRIWGTWPKPGRAKPWLTMFGSMPWKRDIPRCQRPPKPQLHRILAERPLPPEKVRYYLERRDPDFETKMREVLIVYQEVALQNQRHASVGERPSSLITVSVDEKPGLQAIANTSPDLPPVPGRHAGNQPDHDLQTPGHLHDSGGSGSS